MRAHAPRSTLTGTYTGGGGLQRHPVPPGCGASQVSAAEMNAFYLDTTEGKQQVMSGSYAGIAYCDHFDPSGSCERSDYLGYGNGLVNAGLFFQEAGAGPSVSYPSPEPACARRVNTSDSMLSDMYCPARAGSQGRVRTTYSPTWVSVGGDGTVIGDVQASAQSDCGNAPQLRVQLVRFTPPAAASDDELAATYAPLLRFDSDEVFRPLNADLFLKERIPHTVAAPPPASGELTVTLGHNVCGHGLAGSTPPLNCQTADGVQSLEGPWGATDFIDIDGSGAPSQYYTPNAACRVGGLQDCDTGAASSSYYHVVRPVGSAYTYIDYWYLYRFNDFYESISSFQHEADWEGITVAPSPSTPGTFDFVSFSQHGKWYSYPRASLQCDAGGNCGTDAAKAGVRVWSYVAQGSHANYPTACSSLCFQDNGPKAPILGFPLRPEKKHDGMRPWGRNQDGAGTGSLLPFPSLGLLQWVDFPGKWGTGDVRSPGCQQPHFSSPDLIDGGSDCGVANGTPRAQLRAGALRTPGASPNSTASVRDCEAWLGPDVAIAACDPKTLRESIDEGTFASALSPRIQYTAGRGPVRIGSGGGVTQVIGPPVEPGRHFEVMGVAGHLGADQASCAQRETRHNPRTLGPHARKRPSSSIADHDSGTTSATGETVRGPNSVAHLGRRYSFSRSLIEHMRRSQGRWSGRCPRSREQSLACPSG